MDDFVKNIDNIRKMMFDMKSEKYAIANTFLSEQDEYIKTLYFKVLVTIIQYKNDPTDMQILFAKRLLKGALIDSSFEGFLRKALEITETDMQEFFSNIGTDDTKYYFTLDGILLVSMGKAEKESFEYLSEIIELLDVSKKDLEYISMVAKSILQQDATCFDEAKKLLYERVSRLDFTPYVQNFYTGAIVDSDLLVHYSATDKELSQGMEYPHNFNGKTVIFENMNICIDERWYFDNCREVIFKNCTIHCKNDERLTITAVIVKFEKCIVENFTEGVLSLYYTKSIHIRDCEFINCTGRCGYGSVLSICGVDPAEEIIIDSNKFIECKSFDDTIIMEKVCAVESMVIVKNEFVGCEALRPYGGVKTLFGKKPNQVVEENNSFVGGIDKLFID